MQIALENKKKVITDFPKNVIKRKNIVEEGGTLGSRVKKEDESIYLRAKKMMKDQMEPFAVPIVVRAVPIVVQTAKQTTQILDDNSIGKIVEGKEARSQGGTQHNSSKG